MGQRQGWIYNNETGNQRVEVPEFLDELTQCSLDPAEAFAGLQR